MDTLKPLLTAAACNLEAILLSQVCSQGVHGLNAALHENTAHSSRFMKCISSTRTSDSIAVARPGGKPAHDELIQSINSIGLHTSWGFREGKNGVEATEQNSLSGLLGSLILQELRIQIIVLTLWLGGLWFFLWSRFLNVFLFHSLDLFWSQRVSSTAEFVLNGIDKASNKGVSLSGGRLSINDNSCRVIIQLTIGSTAIRLSQYSILFLYG